MASVGKHQGERRLRRPRSGLGNTLNLVENDKRVLIGLIWFRARNDGGLL